MIGQPPLMSLLCDLCREHGADRARRPRSGAPARYNVPVSLPGVTWQRYTFTGTHILAAALTAVIAGLLYLFLYHTRLGKAMRAVANNREAAELSGIPTTRVLALAFGLGVALAACRRHADRDHVSVHRAFRRGLSAQELRRHRARRARQSGGRAGRRRGARPGRGLRRAVHAGELDAGHRVRPVRPGADRLSRAAFSPSRAHEKREDRRDRPRSGEPDALSPLFLDHRARRRRLCRRAAHRRQRAAAREPAARRRLHHARQQSQHDARLCRIHQFRQHRLLRPRRLYQRLSGQRACTGRWLRRRLPPASP